MAMGKSGQKTKNQKVTFSINAPEAKKVVLLGDFNKWDPKMHPMEKKDNGLWKRTMTLAPNKYEYKFLIDGEWKEDPQNDQTCANCFGTVNSVLNLS
jgi:1,4-alpha-glucan branching enzyme